MTSSVWLPYSMHVAESTACAKEPKKELQSKLVRPLLHFRFDFGFWSLVWGF